MTLLPTFDRVKETTTTMGTGTITLLGAVQDYQSFSVVGPGNQTYYTIDDGVSNWEVGIGTWSSTGPTLTRPVLNVLASSSGGLVNFGAGTKKVYLSLPAEVFNVISSAFGTATGENSLALGFGSTDNGINNLIAIAGNTNSSVNIGSGNDVGHNASFAYINYDFSQASIVPTDNLLLTATNSDHYAIGFPDTAGSPQIAVTIVAPYTAASFAQAFVEAFVDAGFGHTYTAGNPNGTIRQPHTGTSGNTTITLTTDCVGLFAGNFIGGSSSATASAAFNFNNVSSLTFPVTTTATLILWNGTTTVTYVFQFLHLGTTPTSPNIAVVGDAYDPISTANNFVTACNAFSGFTSDFTIVNNGDGTGTITQTGIGSDGNQPITGSSIVGPIFPSVFTGGFSNVNSLAFGFNLTSQKDNIVVVGQGSATIEFDSNNNAIINASTVQLPSGLSENLYISSSSNVGYIANNVNPSSQAIDDDTDYAFQLSFGSGVMTLQTTQPSQPWSSAVNVFSIDSNGTIRSGSKILTSGGQLYGYNNHVLADSSNNICLSTGGLKDSAGALGTSGQNLTSTGTSAIWQTPAVTLVYSHAYVGYGANSGPNTIYTPSANGLYRVNCNLWCVTQSGTLTTASVTIAWTDPSGGTGSAVYTITMSSPDTPLQSQPTVFCAESGQPITLGFSSTGGWTFGAITALVTLEQLM